MSANLVSNFLCALCALGENIIDFQLSRKERYERKVVCNFLCALCALGENIGDFKLSCKEHYEHKVRIGNFIAHLPEIWPDSITIHPSEDILKKKDKYPGREFCSFI